MAGRRVREQAGEAVLRGSAAGRPVGGGPGRPRGTQRAVSWTDREAGRAAVGWAREQVARVVAQAARGVAARGGRADGGPLAGGRHDRLPADAAGEGVVLQFHPPGISCCGIEGELEAGGLQSARPRGEGQPRGPGQVQRGRSAVHGERQPASDLGQLPAQHLGAAEATLLHGRDLRLVQDVAHINSISRDRDGRQVVQAEVPQRVGGRCRRGGQYD
jgi:hypothetical protein